MVLRDPRPDDAEPLAQAFVDDPGLAAAVGLSSDADLAWWQDTLAREEENRASGGSLYLTIEDRHEGAPIGMTGVDDIDATHRRAEVAIWLARRARSSGRGLETLTLLRDWAIPALDLIRLQLRTLPDNQAMIACAERAGFVMEGVLRAYTFERGKPCDNAIMAVVP